MPVDVSQLDSFIAAVEARYSGTVIFGDAEPAIERIPTGSLELDYITGGGIPIGRFSRFWGGYSSGKSFACWNVVREAQKLGMTCAYYNIEKQYDKKYVKKLGVDVDKLLVINGTTIEEIGTKLETFLGAVHLHVLDSCSSAVSIDMLNSAVEDWQMGLGPRAWGKVFLRALERFDQNQNVVIQVDQARDTFGYGGGEHPPGGRLMEHNSSMTLYFRRGGWLFRKDGILKSDKEAAPGKTLSGKAEADGFEINVRVAKSRVCRPLRQAHLHYAFDPVGYELGQEYARAAKFFKVVDTSGSWFTIDGQKIQGEAKLRQIIMDRPELQKKIRQAVMQSAI
jgi:recombination protein RecA